MSAEAMNPKLHKPLEHCESYSEAGQRMQRLILMTKTWARVGVLGWRVGLRNVSDVELTVGFQAFWFGGVLCYLSLSLPHSLAYFSLSLVSLRALSLSLCLFSLFSLSLYLSLSLSLSPSLSRLSL